jgi:hypothetical protein
VWPSAQSSGATALPVTAIERPRAATDVVTETSGLAPAKARATSSAGADTATIRSAALHSAVEKYWAVAAATMLADSLSGARNGHPGHRCEDCEWTRVPSCPANAAGDPDSLNCNAATIACGDSRETRYRLYYRTSSEALQPVGHVCLSPSEAAVPVDDIAERLRSRLSQ